MRHGEEASGNVGPGGDLMGSTWRQGDAGPRKTRDMQNGSPRQRGTHCRGLGWHEKWHGGSQQYRSSTEGWAGQGGAGEKKKESEGGQENLYFSIYIM